jgi:hypothetical protein
VSLHGPQDPGPDPRRRAVPPVRYEARRRERLSQRGLRGAASPTVARDLLLDRVRAPRSVKP